MPFIWDPALSNGLEILDPDETKARKTVEHAQLIIRRYETLKDMDITTAETTAKLINGNKIIPGLLKLIFDPGPKRLGPPAPRLSDQENTELQVQRLPISNSNDIGAQSIRADETKPDILDESELGAEKTLSEKAKESMVDGRAQRKEDESEPSSNHARSASNEGKEQKGLRKEKALVLKHGKNIADPANVVNPIKPKRKTKLKIFMSKTQHKSQQTTQVRASGSRRQSDPNPSESSLEHGDILSTLSESTAFRTQTPSGTARSTSKPRDILSPNPRDSRTQRVCFPQVVIPETFLPPLIDVPKRTSNIQQTLMADHSKPLENKASEERNSLFVFPPGDESITQGHPLLISSPEDSGDSDGSGYSDSTTQPSPGICELDKTLTWAYTTHTGLDKVLLDAGIWLWEKPPTYFDLHHNSMTMSDRTTLAPVVVSHESTSSSCPEVGYDGERVHIIPHADPWDDVRSMECHPDFLPPCKLVEYQACEAAGYPIWRHDRDLLPCRNPRCDAMLLDTDPLTTICLGCGPKTSVRYCSFQHQLEDLEEHWSECGDPSLIMERLIDHTTQPRYFFTHPPAIVQRVKVNKFKLFNLERQKLYFMRNGGYYTIFDSPENGGPKTLSWPKSHPDWKELDQRIERLLNILFLDPHNDNLTMYLYRLLRELQYFSKEGWKNWNYMKKKFQKQFLLGEFNPTGRSHHDLGSLERSLLCECEWSGTRNLPDGHRNTCKVRSSPKKGSELPSTGLRAVVEQYENKHWILRAWRRQHPTEKDWRVRNNGYGLVPMQPEEETYGLGPGWTGWGGKESNIRAIECADT